MVCSIHISFIFIRFSHSALDVMQETIDNIGSNSNTAVIIALTNSPSEKGKLVRRMRDFNG